MNEELNIYDVVRYFVEKSGMLFFSTKDDIKIAYDRISTIINCKNKYFNIEINDKLIELKKYYDYFVENFDEYSQIEENKNLFLDIIRLDSSIMFCGSESSFNSYIKNVKNNLKEANSSSFFFQRRYAVREGLRKVDGLFQRIRMYKKKYNLNFEHNEIEDILDFLKLDSLAKEAEIVDAYNNMLLTEYERIVKANVFDMSKLQTVSNKFAYIRDILMCFYDLDEKLEKRTLLEIYSHPLNSEPEYYKAFNFFKLSPNCSKEEMIEAVEKTIDNIANFELVNSVSMSTTSSFAGGVPFVDGKRNDDTVMEKVDYYKSILYNYFGIEISEEDKLVPDEENTSFNYDNVQDYSHVFSSLFSGLDYNEAKRLYFALMNNFLSTHSKENDIKIEQLDSYWNSIENELKQQNHTQSGKIKK